MMIKQDLWKPIKEEQLNSLNATFWKKLAGGSLAILSLSVLLLYLSPRFKLLNRENSLEKKSLTDSAIAKLNDFSASERITQLQHLIETKEDNISSIDIYRSRYLLAIDSLEKNKPQKALEYLNELEINYPLLAPYILLRRAEAYVKTEQMKQATTVTQNVIDNYPHSPVIAELLNLVSRDRSQQDIEYLTTNFPYHPQVQKIIRQRIQDNPNDWQSLLLLVTYNRQTDLDKVRDRLVLEFPDKLTKQDWQVIADSYWRAGEHRKAADAYRLSPPSPQNLYRTARGFHRNGNFATAKKAYQRLIREYHDAQETGLALHYIARLSSADEKIAYLDIAIAKFPTEVPKALLSKAVIYEKFDKADKANASRQQALTEYPDSEAVLKYRWQKAYKAALAGDYQLAWQWGEAIAKTQSIESDPKAIFWVGKWAEKAGKTNLAKIAWQNVLDLHPQSYFAWRAAVLLGHDVGDFATLRQIQPSVELIGHYEPLPIGSPILQELYLLDQYEDAWVQLQAELSNPQHLTVEEQFTDGLLLVKSGEIRAGIQSIWNLAQTESPLDRAKWRSLRTSDAYWYALFPFPYHQTIIADAKQNEINALLPLSVIRKESTFDPKIDSHVGAVGLMQIIPRTANWIAKQNQIATYDLTKPEDNIRMGTWYLGQNHLRYKNNSLYAIASYNAGTGNVNRWLNYYSLSDPDLFVEQIPFPETKDYVEGVFGNYWNYLRLYDPKYRD